MARELNYTVSEIFNGSTTTRGTYYYYSDNHIPLNPKRVYMDIPINKSVFELPTFAFDTFLKTLENKEFDNDAIVAVLRTRNRTPKYKTLSRYIKDILIEDFLYDTLVMLEVKDNGDTPLIYYGTHGMILDSQFTPIMMCSWLIERTADGESNYKYDFLRPIMRINPHCYLAKEDSMERFIANKLPLVALDTQIYMPHTRGLPDCFKSRSHLTSAELKIEIDNCPFVLRHAAVPSISTTNEELLKIAIDHIDEIIQ